MAKSVPTNLYDRLLLTSYTCKETCVDNFVLTGIQFEVHQNNILRRLKFRSPVLILHVHHILECLRTKYVNIDSDTIILESL